MKRLFISALIAGGLAATSGLASTLDFIDYADDNEQGVASGTSITSSSFDGETITFTANNGWNPYFDNGGAGLGVCKTLSGLGTGNAGGTANRCSSGADDDNVTMQEAVTIAWTGARTLSNVLFTGEWHVDGSPEFLHLEAAGTDDKQRSDNTFLFGTSATGGALSRYTFGEFASLSFGGITSATFAFDDVSFDPLGVGADRHLARNADQFYLASAVISAVPVPAALPLLLAGLGGLGFMGRRRRKTA